MLFGATTVADDTSDDRPVDELRVCALNVNSPSAARAQHTAEWLLASRSNVLVLTEMQPTDGGRHILACLQAEGFTTTCAPGWTTARYLTAIATRGVDTVAVHPSGFDPRIVAVDISANVGTTVRLVGLYGPTNGMTDDSSRQRSEFQTRFLDYLATIATDALCVTGDLNVVEPGHQPHLPAFRDHDYVFYTSLLTHGLRDAFRELNPSGGEHSWLNPRFGSQRLDHSLVSIAAGELRACVLDHSPRTHDISDHAALVTTIGLRAAAPAPPDSDSR